jgi:hypothetical protein
MSEVVFVVYSEGMQTENQPQGQRTIIQGPLLGLSPNYIPGLFSFVVTVGIIGVDVDVDHTLKYIFKDSNGKNVIPETELALPNATGNSKNLQPEMRGVTVSIDIRNADLQVEGQYISEFYLDGTSLGSFLVQVRQLLKPEDQK